MLITTTAASSTWLGLGQRFRMLSQRLRNISEHEVKRTALQVIAGDGQLPIIQSCSTQGFSIGSIKIIGPAVITPKAFFQWKIGQKDDITVKSLSIFPIMVPRIEVLVIGVGDRIAILKSEVMGSLRRHAIAVEVQDTANACATFNFLLEEGRQVAAALIPPTNLVDI